MIDKRRSFVDGGFGLVVQHDSHLPSILPSKASSSCVHTLGNLKSHSLPSILSTERKSDLPVLTHRKRSLNLLGCEGGELLLIMSALTRNQSRRRMYLHTHNTTPTARGYRSRVFRQMQSLRSEELRADDVVPV